MPLDPSIPLAGRTPTFGLLDVGELMARRQQLQAQQLQLDEALRQRQEAERIRGAYAEEYGGAPALAGQAQAPGVHPGPGGLAGQAPVAEQQRGGGPTEAFPGGLAAQAPAGSAGSMPPASVSQAPQSDPFIRQLYTISPKAGRDAEQHAYQVQALQMQQQQARVEYLSQVARGVLTSNTQQAYDIGRAMLMEQGMPESQLPPVYDPQLMRFYATVGEDAADRFKMAQTQLAQAQQQRLYGSVPDYGFGDELNSAIYSQFGHQLRSGQPPTPAMVAQARQQRLSEQGQPQEAALRTLRQEELGLDIAKKRRETGGALSAPEQRQVALDIRGDIRQEPSFKAFQDIRNGYDSVRTGVTRQDGPGDLAMINGLQKILDPGVSVRQEEFKTVAASQGFLSRVLNIPGRIMEGDLLSKAARSRVLDLATTLARDKAAVARQELTTVYGPLAREAGLDLEQLVPLQLTGTKPSAAPREPSHGRSPHHAVSPDQLTPDQLAEEEAWLLKTLGRSK